MPAPNEYVWYKWYPAKALTSLRWASLTVTEEGVFRRMYDLASLAQPSSRRGYFYEHDVPANLVDVAKFLRIDPRTAQKCVDRFAKMGLMEQDGNGAWGFTNFQKHQRTAPLRVRKDGLGSAEIGAELAQDRREIGAIDVEAYKEEADKEKNPPISPLGGRRRVSAKPINQTQDQAIATYVDERILPWVYCPERKFGMRIPKEKMRGVLMRSGENHGLWILERAFERGANGANPHPARLIQILNELEEEQTARSKRPTSLNKGLRLLRDELADVERLFEAEKEPDPGPGA